MVEPIRNECTICMMNFETAGPQRPIMLPCSHSICEHDVHQLLQKARSTQQANISCPECREQFSVNGFQLRPNIGMIRIMEQVTQSRSPLQVIDTNAGATNAPNVDMLTQRSEWDQPPVGFHGHSTQRKKRANSQDQEHGTPHMNQFAAPLSMQGRASVQVPRGHFAAVAAQCHGTPFKLRGPQAGFMLAQRNRIKVEIYECPDTGKRRDIHCTACGTFHCEDCCAQCPPESKQKLSPEQWAQFAELSKLAVRLTKDDAQRVRQLVSRSQEICDLANQKQAEVFNRAADALKTVQETFGEAMAKIQLICQQVLQGEGTVQPSIACRSPDPHGLDRDMQQLQQDSDNIGVQLNSAGQASCMSPETAPLIMSLVAQWQQSSKNWTSTVAERGEVKLSQERIALAESFASSFAQNLIAEAKQLKILHELFVPGQERRLTQDAVPCANGYHIVRSATNPHELLAFPRDGLENHSCILFRLGSPGSVPEMKCFKMEVTSAEGSSYSVQSGRKSVQQDVALAHQLVVVADVLRDENVAVGRSLQLSRFVGDRFKDKVEAQWWEPTENMSLSIGQRYLALVGGNDFQGMVSPLVQLAHLTDLSQPFLFRKVRLALGRVGASVLFGAQNPNRLVVYGGHDQDSNFVHVCEVIDLNADPDSVIKFSNLITLNFNLVLNSTSRLDLFFSAGEQSLVIVHSTNRSPADRHGFDSILQQEYIQNRAYQEMTFEAFWTDLQSFKSYGQVRSEVGRYSGASPLHTMVGCPLYDAEANEFRFVSLERDQEPRETLSCWDFRIGLKVSVNDEQLSLQEVIESEEQERRRRASRLFETYPVEPEQFRSQQ